MIVKFEEPVIFQQNRASVRKFGMYHLSLSHNEEISLGIVSLCKIHEAVNPLKNNLLVLLDKCDIYDGSSMEADVRFSCIGTCESGERKHLVFRILSLTLSD